MPRLEIVNVPPSMSSRWSLPSRARPTTAARAAATSASDRCSAPWITGTISPRSVATAIATFAYGKTSSSSSVNWTLTARWRMSAAAHTFTSTSVTVTRSSGSSSRRRSTSWFTASMSAEMTSWKTGISHASVSRRAIVRRTEVSGTRSTPSATRAGSAGGAAAGAAAGAAPGARRSTSSATIRPSGPVPLTDARSTPCSRASRRASGEALMRSPSCRSGRRRRLLGGRRPARLRLGRAAAREASQPQELRPPRRRRR